MLHLISKTRFENQCLGKTPTKIINGLILTVPWDYFEINNRCWLLYIPFFNIGLVFGEYNEEDLSITYEDWKLTKISDKPDPKFILNSMKLFLHIDSELYKICDTGSWELENDFTGEIIEFSIRICGDYFRYTAIGYEERLERPLKINKIKLIDNFINTICYGIRGDNNESSVGSEQDT